jgi:predicted metal-dependent phosphoesterase TrpH
VSNLKADLHVHTYFFDGEQSPEEIASLAKQKKLDYISVCDHDVITAYPRLSVACAKEHVKLIQGVEISVSWEKQWLHLLAYDFDIENEGMQMLLSKSRLEISEFDDSIIRNMAADFPQLDMAEYEIYQRPRERGGWKSINYIYDKGLSENLLDSMKYEKKYSGNSANSPEISKACRVIKAAGGVPILAHPGEWWTNEAGEVPAKFTALKELGLEGVECYYPKHSPEFTRICIDFCERHYMYITCGGDCHGEFARNYKPGAADRYLGVMDVDMENLRLWQGFGERYNN